MGPSLGVSKPVGDSNSLRKGASARSARKCRSSGQIRPCDPRIDVVGIDAEPRSIGQALMAIYAIGAVIGTLSEEGSRLLEVIQAKGPGVHATLRKWGRQDLSGSVMWPRRPGRPFPGVPREYRSPIVPQRS